MVITSVQYLGLRFNGLEWPFALLNINGYHSVYEHDAVVYLIRENQSNGPVYEILKQVLLDIELNRHSALADLSESDISGQQELFTND